MKYKELNNGNYNILYNKIYNIFYEPLYQELYNSIYQKYIKQENKIVYNTITPCNVITLDTNFQIYKLYIQLNKQLNKQLFSQLYIQISNNL